jgi:hypothetical protein
MNYRDKIAEFVIEGFERVAPTVFETDDKNKFLLKNRVNNFITEPKGKFDYHRWAGSFKSSQAFTYNIFSGVKNKELEFEFQMRVFDRPAQIDVKIENTETNTVELFEVKMFEIINLSKKNIEFKDQYDNQTAYSLANIHITESFIAFLDTVINYFEKENRSIYVGGIKQLCSHLLGILNEMEMGGKLFNKKVKLYSLCFDNQFFPKFQEDIENYKETLVKFKVLVDKFLIDINFDSRIEYCGFLSANEYIKNNEELIGDENYKYAIDRYFYE